MICAWCKRDLGPAPGCEADSHGTCAPCAEKARGEAGQPQPVRAALVELLRQKARLGHLGSCQAHRHACEVERLLRLVRKRERAAEAHYVVATLSEARALRPGRPFRAPHYTCSTRALREETLLAEGGVLYLDQLEDWRRGALAEVTDAPLLGVVVAFAAPAADLDRWNRNADAVREALSRVHECFASGCTAVATTGERAPLSRGRGEVVYHWCPAHAPSSKATS